MLTMTRHTAIATITTITTFRWHEDTPSHDVHDDTMSTMD